ncbi:MAG: hypothetical protein ABW122_16010 [Ilumatobacteraceae bacterium]
MAVANATASGVSSTAHSDDVFEVQRHGSHGRGERAALLGGDGVDAGEELGVGGEGVMSFGDRILGVPGIQMPGAKSSGAS